MPLQWKSRSPSRDALFVAGVFALAAAGWLLLSGFLLKDLIPSTATNPYLHYAFHGLLDIAVFLLVVFLLARWAIENRDETNRRLEHINNVLKAIRNVNQLITRVDDRSELIQGACTNLVETLGFRTAWIALLDEKHRVVHSARQGFDASFEKLDRNLARSELPECARIVLAKDAPPLYSTREGSCSDCPMAEIYDRESALTARLEFEGTVFGVIGVSVPLEFANSDDDKELFLEVAGDIAFALHKIERSEKGRRAEEARSQLARIVEVSNDLMALVDREYCYVSMNKAYEAFFGVATADHVGKPVANLLGSGVFETTLKPKLDRCFSGKTVAFQRVFGNKEDEDRTLDIRYFPLVAPDGGVSHVVVCARDVTDSISAEKALVESETRHRAIFEYARDAIMIMDGEEFVDCNPATLEMFGTSREEFVGAMPGDFSPIIQPGGTDSETAAAGFIQKALDGEPQFFRWRHLRPNGEEFDCEVQLNRVEFGANTRIMAVLRDITEEVRRESQQRQAQKLESLGTLASGIAHDFNNVLQGIVGYSQLLLDAAEAESDERTYVEEILIAADRAAELIRQILTFSRQSERELRPLAIHTVIKEVLRLLGGGLPANTTIESRIEPHCPSVLADPVQIYQLTLNLCTNASQAMGPGPGTITVSLQETELITDQFADYGQVKPGRYVRLAIEDTGSGIPKEVLPTIFEPYYTTKSQSGGTGLGLSVVLGIAKAHKAAICVDSDVGKGTEVSVYFPVHEAPAEPLRPAPHAPGDFDSGARVLFVDDEASLCRVAKLSLEQLGFEVDTCTSPRDALEEIGKTPQRYDVLVTDMTMPEMLGTELAEKVRQVRADLPVILCTGFSSLIDDEKAKALGIERLVNKPVMDGGLIEAISETVAGKTPRHGPGRSV